MYPCQPVTGCVFLFNEKLGCGLEIVVSVLALFETTSFVPIFAVLSKNKQTNKQTIN